MKLLSASPPSSAGPTSLTCAAQPSDERPDRDAVDVQDERLVGLKKTFIYNRIGEGSFPRPAPLGRVLRRWARHEIDAWIADRNDVLRALRRADSAWLPQPEPCTAPA